MPAGVDQAEYITIRGHAADIVVALREGTAPADYMRICHAMIDTADIVMMLPNSKQSYGAQVELEY